MKFSSSKWKNNFLEDIWNFISDFLPFITFFEFKSIVYIFLINTSFNLNILSLTSLNFLIESYVRNENETKNFESYWKFIHEKIKAYCITTTTSDFPISLDNKPCAEVINARTTLFDTIPTLHSWFKG